MKISKKLAQLYPVTNKRQNLSDFIVTTLNKTLAMFAYTGLPDTVDRAILEKYLQVFGYVIFYQYQGKLYFTNASLNGQEISPYNEPTKAVINVPAFNLNQTLTINKNCVLVKNDDLMQGLYPNLKKYGTLLIENEITMLLNTYNDRIQTLIAGGSDQAKNEADKYISNIIDGNLGALAENSFLKDLTVHNTQAQGKIEFSDLVVLQQYLKSDLYNWIGLSSLNNMKKARLNTDEVQANDDNIYPFVDNMLTNRKEGIKMVNKLFNGNIAVDFNGTWQDKAQKRTNPNASTTSSNQVDELQEVNPNKKRVQPTPKQPEPEQTNPKQQTNPNEPKEDDEK